jgi:anti-sigma factor RsiW
MSDDFLPCGNANTFVAGELPPEEREDYEAHLAICADCQREVANTRILFRRLSTAPNASVSRDFERLVFSRLREAAPEAPRRSSWPRIAAAAAAVTIFFTGVAVLMKTAEHRSEHKATASSAAR